MTSCFSISLVTNSAYTRSDSLAGSVDLTESCILELTDHRAAPDGTNFVAYDDLAGHRFGVTR